MSFPIYFQLHTLIMEERLREAERDRLAAAVRAASRSTATPPSPVAPACCTRETMANPATCTC